MKLKDKVAVITGGSRGIGRATALLFATEGAKVTIVYKEQHEKAQEVQKIIGKDNCLLVSADLSTNKEYEIEAVLDLTRSEFKTDKIDILINNAGEIIQPSSWEMDEQTWHKTIDVNLTSTWLTTKEVLKWMPKGGTIVNVSSVYGILGAAPILAYTVAKAGVINLTKSFAKELGPHIRVNAVVPGNIWTDMTKSAGTELLEEFKKATPLGRIGEPHEIAKAILFLASNDASYITGTALVVDGGYSLK